MHVLAICIILVHLLIRYRLHFLPESVAVVSLGILMGAVIKIIEFKKLANWKEEEMFRPNMFFLLLLPPIIFESGYSLHKGNFFQNIGSITLFAVFGTAISAFVVGGGIYFLGQADVISKLNMTDSFAFGSLISAVDPVATIAIFNALHVDPVLNMLVFGESILNDAVSIVLTNTAEGLTRKNVSDVSGWQTFLQALGYFLKMFFGSAALGTLTGLISALVLKHIDLRKTPSLEFGMMIIFAYLPYGLAEGISLSGIMAILFSGIVMSHYTHHNLSPVTQILMQQTLRTVAFLCETCVFAFLGLSIFSFPHKFEISFVIWCIVLVLFGRAVNIFPLSYLLNFFRDHKITPKMMFIMWFSAWTGQPIRSAQRPVKWERGELLLGAPLCACFPCIPEPHRMSLHSPGGSVRMSTGHDAGHAQIPENRVSASAASSLLPPSPLTPFTVPPRPAGGHPLRPEPAPGPGAHGEAAAHRHHHNHHRALHHPAAGRQHHAPHPPHGHRGRQGAPQEQEGRQPQQDREDGQHHRVGAPVRAHGGGVRSPLHQAAGPERLPVAGRQVPEPLLHAEADPGGPPPWAHPDENPHQQVVRGGTPGPLRLRGRRAGAAVTKQDAVASGQVGPQHCRPASPWLPGQTLSQGP
nr:sodium/hydrogen exchanger 8 isoform X2 [Vicugna pacos]